MLRLTPTVLGSFVFLSMTSTVSAGWNNVFQVCCHDCRPRARTSFFRDPCPEPQPERRVEYRRSFYYEPVTVMKPERFTEEVPVQVKSYYWDPVTTYTRSSYYDPCSGQCQDICVPRTSYVRREQCNTVMRYVERVRMVPVQTQRKVEVTQPVVTYYYPETRRYTNDCDLPASANSPSVERLPSSPPSVMPDSSSPERIAPQNIPTTPNSFKRPVSPPARINARTTSFKSNKASIIGEVVLNDQQTPKPGTKLVFVNASNLNDREFVTSDSFGHFQLQLNPGDWYIYLSNGDGKAHFQRKVSVASAEKRNFLVVSR